MYFGRLFLLPRIRNDHASPGPFVVSLNHPCKDFRMLIRNDTCLTRLASLQLSVITYNKTRIATSSQERVIIPHEKSACNHRDGCLG